jgi:hypothetical protein
MSALAQPLGSDIRLEIGERGTWRVACPPRLRGQDALRGAAGLGAGFVLGLVSLGGALEAMNHPSWGAQVFMMGWLVPFGFIGLLLGVHSVKTLARIWQWSLIESDGSTFRHRTVAPWGQHNVLEAPLEQVEGFDSPEPDDEALAGESPGSVVVWYRATGGGKVLSHRCAAGIQLCEISWLAATLNPLIERTRAARGQTN